MTIQSLISKSLMAMAVTTGLYALTAVALPEVAAAKSDRVSNVSTQIQSVSVYDQPLKQTLAFYRVEPTDGSDRVILRDTREGQVDNYVLAGHQVMIVDESEDGTEIEVAVVETGKMGWIDRSEIVEAE